MDLKSTVVCRLRDRLEEPAQGAAGRRDGDGNLWGSKDEDDDEETH